MSNATALTVVERVEQSPVVAMLDDRGQALIDLLPDAAAATRFRRVVLQALTKNPELLECSPESVVLSVFEAAAQGLEPTGAAGGAHLVPYNVKISKNPDRYEKRAQLIPDYRGVIRLVTKPPSEVLSLEARVVKEGDEFSYTLGTDAAVHHVPSLGPGRSEKATTHVYAIARLKGGASIPDVEDRAGIERIQKRGRSSSPWATDWDEMAKKTIIKRIAKVLPVRPEIRSILVREDELGDDRGTALEAPGSAPSRSKTARLASRLASPPADDHEPADAESESVEGEIREDPTWLAGENVAPEPEVVQDAAPATTAVADDVVSLIRDTASASGMQGPATPPQLARLSELLGGTRGTGVVPAALTLLWGEEATRGLSAAQAQSLLNVADSRGPETFRAVLSAIAEQARAAAAA